AEDPARADDGLAGDRRQLRRDAAGHERARRRGAGARGGGGRVVGPRGASAVMNPADAIPTGRTPIIGLTGPIGCGKTTVAGWLDGRPGRGEGGTPGGGGARHRHGRPGDGRPRARRGRLGEGGEFLGNGTARWAGGCATAVRSRRATACGFATTG